MLGDLKKTFEVRRTVWHLTTLSEKIVLLVCFHTSHRQFCATTSLLGIFLCFPCFGLDNVPLKGRTNMPNNALPA